mgnify:CR=1 FL=1
MAQPEENTTMYIFRDADLIVEVAHPSISDKYGELFLQEADFMVSFLGVFFFKFGILMQIYNSSLADFFLFTESEKILG